MGKELQADFYNKVYKTGGKNKKYFKSYKDTAWLNIWLKICEIMKEHGSSKVLDLGCGSGQFAQCASDSGLLNYIGVDFSKEAIAVAKVNLKNSNMNTKFLTKDIYTFDFNSIEYDCVVATEFLEHIERDIEVLNNIKSGTLIIATLPNKDSAGHVRYYSEEFSITKKKIEDRYKDIGEFLSFESVKYVSGINHDYLFTIRKK